MNHKDLIRLVIIASVQVFTAFMAHYAADPRDRSATLIPTLRLGSYTVLAIAALLFVRTAAFGQVTLKNQPSLSVKSIVVYVYGLGILVYVTTYCLLDLGVCRVYYLVALAGISVDDFAERWAEGRGRKLILGLSTLSAVATFVVQGLLSPDSGEVIDALMTGKLYVFAFGFVLPITVPIAYLFIRGRRFYNPVTVMQFMHLSMPFAVHASISTLLSLSLVSYTPDTDYYSLHFNFSKPDPDQAARLVSSSDVASPILALCMIPCVFLAIQTTLLYSIVDFLAPAAAVAATRHALEAATFQAQDLALVFAGLAALGLRLYNCFCDQDDYAGVLYSSEEDSSSREDAKASHDGSGEVLRRLQQVAVVDLEDEI